MRYPFFLRYESARDRLPGVSTANSTHVIYASHMRYLLSPTPGHRGQYSDGSSISRSSLAIGFVPFVMAPAEVRNCSSSHGLLDHSRDATPSFRRRLHAGQQKLNGVPTLSDRNPTNFNAIWYVEITYNSGHLHLLNNFPNPEILSLIYIQQTLDHL
jgi:hypothetical protein